MSFSKHNNKKQGHANTAAETLTILDQGSYTKEGQLVDIYDMLDLSMKNTVVHKPNYRAIKLPNNPKHETSIEVSLETTLSGCKRVVSTKAYNAVALNFASAKRPGGGFITGANAQEESLARATGLYLCIGDEYEGSNTVTMYEHNRKNPDRGIYSDYMVYSPAVPVFRDDTDTLLSQKDVYTVAFITAPAVNRRNALEHNVKEEAIDNAMRKRIALILGVAINNGHDAIVLGAYGCGVFGNDVTTVATIFKELLDGQFRGYFKKVVFSILGEYEHEAFQSIFGV